MIIFILVFCLVLVLTGLLAYRVEREQMRDRLNELEHKLNDALSANHQLERDAKHWHQVAAECRQLRIRLLDQLSVANQRLAERR